MKISKVYLSHDASIWARANELKKPKELDCFSAVFKANNL